MRSKHGYFYGQSSDFLQTPPEKRVLVALVPRLSDWQILHEQNWYRIPARSAPKPLDYGHIAFYQTRAWGKQGWAIHFFAKVTHIQEMPRIELLPQEESHPRAHELYYRITVQNLQELPQPIPSQRNRYIVFISTTLNNLVNAREINDLFCTSHLEEILWKYLKVEGIEAERQWYVVIKQQNYCLDFAVFCAKGKIDIECDGDTYHVSRSKAVEDNQRNNLLTSVGWKVLRFSTREIKRTPDDCIGQIRETANLYGGISMANGETRWLTSRINGEQQLNLFGQQEERE